MSSPNPYVAGGPVTYTVQVTNNGSSAVTGASLTDSIPAAVTGVSWTCVVSSGVGSCGAASGSGNAITAGLDLASGAVATFTVSGVVAGGTTGALTSTATVAAPAGVVDPVPGNNTAVDTNSAGAMSADLGISVTPSAATVTSGAPVGYSIVVSNSSTDPAGGTVVTVSIPGGAGFVSASGAGWTCSLTGSTATCSLAAPLGGGASAPPIAFNLLAPAASGPFSLPVSVTSAAADANPANNSAAASVTVTAAGSGGGGSGGGDRDGAPSADLSVAKSVDPALAVTGDLITYTLQVANAGPDPAADVVVTDTLPDSVSLVSAAGVGWACDLAGNVATCRNASVAVGTASPITVVATANHGGIDVTNAASAVATTSDPAAANNTSSVTSRIAARADIGVVKKASSPTYLPGQAITYTITMRNAGPDPVIGARVRDLLPSALRGFRWTCSAVGGACAQFGGTGDIDALVDLGVGGRATFALTGTIPAGTSGPILNRVRVAAPAGTIDTNRANDIAAVTVQRGIGPTHLAVGVTPRLTVLRSGQGPVALHVTTTNTGHEPARGVVACLGIPAGVTVARAAGGHVASGRYCWPTRRLAPGKSVTFTIALRGDTRVARKVTLVTSARALNAAGVLGEHAVLITRTAAKRTGGFTG